MASPSENASCLDGWVRWASAGMLAAFASGAWAAPGKGLKLEGWILQPYYDGTLTYDSNIHQQQHDEQEDFYLDQEGGVRFWRESDALSLTRFDGSLFALARAGARDSGDFFAFGDALRLRVNNGDKLRLQASHAFRRIQDVDLHGYDVQSDNASDDIGSFSQDLVQDIHTLSQQRDIHQLKLGSEYEVTDKTVATLVYWYTAILYDESALLDVDNHTLSAEGAYRITADTSAFLSLREGLQNQEGMTGSTLYSVLRAGVQSKGTDKIAYRAGAGFLSHHTPSSGDIKADTESQFSFETSADWALTKKVTIRGGGENGIQLSSVYEGNALEYLSGWGGLFWQPRPPWTLSTRALYRRERYLNPVEGESSRRVDRRLDCLYRVDYTTTRNFLTLFLQVSPWSVDSNLEEQSYEELRISAGVQLFY